MPPAPLPPFTSKKTRKTPPDTHPTNPKVQIIPLNTQEEHDPQTSPNRPKALAKSNPTSYTINHSSYKLQSIIFNSLTNNRLTKELTTQRKSLIALNL